MAVQSVMGETTRLILVILVCTAAGLAARPQPTPAASDSLTPVIDHHQHLFSPAVHNVSPTLQPMNATELVKLLDEAGIRRAVVLSLGYQFGNPNKPAVPDEYAAVKAENDWTAEQIAPFADRLRGFCGLNPLKPYALEEIARCARHPAASFRPQAAPRQFRRGSHEPGARAEAAEGVRGGQRTPDGHRGSHALVGHSQTAVRRTIGPSVPERRASIRA